MNLQGNVRAILLGVTLAVILGLGCTEAERRNYITSFSSDTDGYGNLDTGHSADADTESYSYSKSGTDGDTDADVDSDADGDIDTDVDADADSDTDTDIDSDADADIDADVDADADNDTDVDVDSDADVDTDTDVDTDADGDADGDTDADADGDSDVELDTDDVCAVLSTSIEAKPVKMMILQDISMSMRQLPGSVVENAGNNKWTQAQSALRQMLESYDTRIRFGFDGFPNVDPAVLGLGLSCNVSDPVFQDSEKNNAQTIINRFGSVTLTLGTPLYKAMRNFADENYAPNFLRDDMDRYLLIVSDGGDTCYQEDLLLLNIQNPATPQQLGSLTEDLLVNHGIKTFVIGFGIGNGMNEDGEALDAIALAGGVLDPSIATTQSSPYYIQAENEAELTSSLEDIAASIVNCNYAIGEQDEEEVNLNLVNVYVNQTQPVPRDKGCAAETGWTWSDDTRTEITLCKEACKMLQTGDVTDLSIMIMCTEDSVLVI